MLDAVLAQMAADAYSTTPTYQRSDCFAVCAPLDDAIVIALRGTNDARSAIQDAKALPRYDRDLGFCHCGFLEDANAVFPAMFADLKGQRLIIIGHSKGGADGLLIGARFAVAGYPVSAIVTFGAPRAGFKRYADTLRMTAVRQYRLGDDPVTEVPWLLGLYRHPRPLRQLAAPWAIDPLEDHHVLRYVAAMKALRTPPASPAQTLTRGAIERPSF